MADAQFGYYTCVMVPTAPGRGARVARWGVNVQGADFSRLESQYRHSAVVGAIAAAVMLVLVGGGCVIWHFRYSTRSGRQGAGLEDGGPQKAAPHVYHNQAQDVEMEETPADDRANGAATPAGSAGSAGVGVGVGGSAEVTGEGEGEVGLTSFKM